MYVYITGVYQNILCNICLGSCTCLPKFLLPCACCKDGENILFDWESNLGHQHHLSGELPDVHTAILGKETASRNPLHDRENKMFPVDQ
jgi:hypothetical protein